MWNTVRKSLCAARSCLVEQVRFSARSKGNRACRQDGQQRGQNYGPKVFGGQEVKKGQLVVKQRIPRFYPGLNVVVKGPKLSLYAAVQGRVAVSYEKVRLNREDPTIATYYANRDTSSMHKKYFNVIPERQMNKFQLVAEI